MPTLTISDIPEELYARLKDRATHNSRSLAEETRQLLEEALRRESEVSPDLDARAQKLREKTPAYLSEEARRKAVREGRA